MMLLSIIMLKVCSLAISHFAPSADPFAVEKSTDESKDTKEEAFDKNEKKMLSCVFTVLDHGHELWIDHLPLARYSYLLRIGSHPVKTVPTPPPDSLI